MDNNLSFGRMSPQMGNANQILGAPTALNQVSPGSPTFQPGLLPPPANAQGAPQAPQMQSFPGAAPTPAQMPMQTPQAPVGVQTVQPQGGTVGLPPGPSEAQMIVKALISRLQSHTKGDEMARGQV